MDRDDQHAASWGLRRWDAALAGDLTARGYAPASVRTVTASMAQLDRWLREHHLVAQNATSAVLAEFVTAYPSARRAGLAAVLDFLRARGVIPGPDRPALSPGQRLLAGFGAYLEAERGLASGSVVTYVSQAAKFVAELGEPVDEALLRLDGAAVIAFVSRQAQGPDQVATVKIRVTATRALLRYLYATGRIGSPLANAVPAVARRSAGVPRGLTEADVTAILATADPATRAGLRDRAVLLLMARLGLRGAEIAALRLEDIHWRAGELTVRGKGSRIERMPLPADVAQALAAYLTDPLCGRPAGRERVVFLTARAPFVPLSMGAMRSITPRACRAAGMTVYGGHRLRHTVASRVLQAGAPLPEVAHLLRHRNLAATSIYAKVDHEALRQVAAPWPLAVTTDAAEEDR